MSITVLSLKQYLAEIAEFRKAKGLRHPLTAIENVALPMDFVRAGSLAEKRQRAMHLLDLVGMADQAHELPSALSGGQQQSVAIARALANEPPIIASDEPTGNLDSKTADVVFQLFERLVEQGKTILVVTHDNDLAKRAKRTIMLADGEVTNEAKVNHDV
jgi:putative ABC transport system ATP-binding protein